MNRIENFQIRPARVEDVPIILELIRDLATYERAPDEVVATEEQLVNVLFGERPAAEVLLAFEGKSPVGFALYFYNFSTWLGRPGLYLEDLFVKPEKRGKGYGRALLVDLAKIACDRGCGRMEWAVLDWNEPAIKFYRALGATPMHEWTVFRLTRDGIAGLAGSGESTKSSSRNKTRSQVAHERTKIEDYAFLSDTQTAALVSRDGCVDWLCLPRFDSPACFASLLGDTKNGHWRFFPEEEVVNTRRSYRGDSLILETEIETKSGAVRLIDFMPPRGENPDIVRIVEGLRGKVSMQMELVVRFDYGQIVPWVRHRNGGLEAIAGPDGLILRTPIETRGKDLTTVAEFTVSEGERIPFVLTWFASHKNPPRAIHYEHALRDTEQYWREWCNQFQGQGKWRDAVMRSLIVLKGLTYGPTGGLVAAATTSLPEQIGGPRNWDYRYCWLRDAAFALLSLLRAG